MTTNTPTTASPSRKLVLKPLSAAGLDKARTTLAAGRYIACQKAPYFQSVLLKLAVREVPPTSGIQTVAVSDDLIMYACMEYVATLSPEEMAGDFIHESLHIFERHGKRRMHRKPALWNYAGDLAINGIVRDMGVKQTPVAIWPKDFGFDDNLAAEAYYALLEQGGGGKKSKGKPAGTPGQGQPSDEREPGPPQPGRGACGSCAGNPTPGEAPVGTDPAGRSNVEVDVAVREVALAIKAQLSKSKGSIPAGLAGLADDVLAPARIPWQRQLDREVRSSCAWSAGAVDNRYDQPGRRQACVGYGVGRPILPRLRRPTPRVAVVLDTSGSMGAGEGSPLQQGVIEAAGILKALGADIDFLAVDAAVHSSKKVSTPKELLNCVRGGGGTSFIPGFRAADQLKPRPNVLIYMTDGYGDAPPSPPRAMRVIWLLIGESAPVPATWGSVVRIED